MTDADVRRAVLEDLEMTGDLPAPAAVLDRLDGLLWRDEVTLREVEAAIADDPVLVGRLLALANGPVFPDAAPVASARAALLRLGLDRVRQLTLIVSAGRLAAHRGLPSDCFMHHSASVARIAQEVARVAAVPVDPALAYMAGLMHDLGALVLRAHHPERSRATRARATAMRHSISDVEREMYGIDHAEIGAVLTARWSLPSAVTAAVRAHHAPAGAPREHRAIAALLHAAESAIVAVGASAHASLPGAVAADGPVVVGAGETLRAVVIATRLLTAFHDSDDPERPPTGRDGVSRPVRHHRPPEGRDR